MSQRAADRFPADMNRPGAPSRGAPTALSALRSRTRTHAALAPVHPGGDSAGEQHQPKHGPGTDAEVSPIETSGRRGRSDGRHLVDRVAADLDRAQIRCGRVVFGALRAAVTDVE